MRATSSTSRRRDRPLVSKVGSAVAFRSILFGSAVELVPDADRQAPACFHDLNLDELVADVCSGREEFELAPLFNVPLPDVDLVAYRQEVFRDLEEGAVRDNATTFTVAMQAMRSYVALASRLRSSHQKQRWHLDAVQVYCDAVTALSAGLEQASLRSRLAWPAGLPLHLRPTPANTSCNTRLMHGTPTHVVRSLKRPLSVHRAGSKVPSWRPFAKPAPDGC